MENNFDKVYGRVGMTTYWLGYGLVGMLVFYYMYLSKINKLLPIFDESKLDELKIISIAISQIIAICLLPYILSRVVWRVKQIDYVDKLANPHRLKRILKTQHVILVGLHYCCFLTCVISCFAAYITTLPVPIAVFGFFLIKASKYAKNND